MEAVQSPVSIYSYTEVLYRLSTTNSSTNWYPISNQFTAQLKLEIPAYSTNCTPIYLNILCHQHDINRSRLCCTFFPFSKNHLRNDFFCLVIAKTHLIVTVDYMSPCCRLPYIICIYHVSGFLYACCTLTASNVHENGLQPALSLEVSDRINLEMLAVECGWKYVS